LLSTSFASLGQLVHDKLPGGLVQSFLQNGVISGVGSVVVFPADHHHLPVHPAAGRFRLHGARRISMDRIMGGAGARPRLHSVAVRALPAIPGIMATRVIDNRRDRLPPS
jgi:ferrous iron transport protein B